MTQIIELINKNSVKIKMTDDPSIIVMHYTVLDFKSTNNLFLQNQLKDGVIAHYVIDSDLNGSIYQYLENNEIGKQAGISYWDGKEDINRYSIGIENVNYGFTEIDKDNGILMNDNFFYYNFPDAQIESLVKITSELIELYDIKPYNIVGHSDIAISAGRKQDPGPLFPWEKLAKDYGIGIWYNLSITKKEFNFVSKIIDSFNEEEKLSFFLNKLIEFGYGSPELVPDPNISNMYQIKNIKENNIIKRNIESLIKNYNMHYRQDKGISSSIDEKDFEIINSLNIMKNIAKENDLSMCQLKDLYHVNDEYYQYFEKYDITYNKIDDTINFLNN
jgi:N-acetylmuramoyl-L-alanine amidase